MNLLREFLLVGLVLGINLMATLIYLFFLGNESRKKRFFQLPVGIQKSLVGLFVGPLLVAPFLPQSKIYPAIPDAIKLPVSLLLTVGGLSFIILAFGKIGVIPSMKEKSHLITRGVYRIVRHPIYAGTILMFLGLILYSNALVSLFYFPISIALYFTMTIFEERSLIQEYGPEYLEYQNQVPKRIIPFIL